MTSGDLSMYTGVYKKRKIFLFILLRNEQASTCGDGVAAVVEELSQRRAAVRPPGLLPINGVQRLVDEQAHGTHDEDPRWSLGMRRDFI